jgi:RND family efflux transporter MFP subunit
LIVCIIATVLAGCESKPAPAVSAASVSSVPTVPVAVAKRADLSNSVTLTAEFTPFQEVDVLAKVAGYVKAMHVDIGDRVREGQLLGTLEVPEMKDDEVRAAAAIDQASAETVSARDEFTRAETSHQIAHLSFERIQKVAQKEPGLIPQQEVDEARSRDLVAEAQVTSANSRLNAVQQKVKVLRAEADRVRTLQAYMNITAPFSGIVTKRYANPGSMIQAATASQTQAMPLVRLSQNHVLRLILPVPESIAASVRPGAPVAVEVPSLQRTFPGTVTRFTSTVDQATRTMNTEVDVLNPTLVILPGMYAQVTLKIAERANTLSIPLDAVDRAGSNPSVYRVDEDGTVRNTRVRLGIETARVVEVLSGLKDGDQVITSGRAGLTDGEKVKPKRLSE